MIRRDGTELNVYLTDHGYTGDESFVIVGADGLVLLELAKLDTMALAIELMVVARSVAA